MGHWTFYVCEIYRGTHYKLYITFNDKKFETFRKSMLKICRQHFKVWLMSLSSQKSER